MKFLVIARLNDSMSMLPQEMRIQLIEGATAFIEKYRKAGKCKDIYNMPGRKGNVSIWEVESAEEANLLFLENPGYPFLNVEMYVLSDFDAHIKAQKEALQQLLARK